MKAKIIMIPGQVKEVEFDSPTSVLDLCIKNNLDERWRDTDSQRNQCSIQTPNGKVNRHFDFNQLVNDGDKVILSVVYGRRR